LLALTPAPAQPTKIQRLAEDLPAELHGTLFGVEMWQYLAILALIVVSVVARKIIQFVVENRVRSFADKLGQHWAARLVDVSASPGATLVMAVLLWVSYPALGLPGSAQLTLAALVRILVVLSITWALYSLVDLLADRMAERAALTESRLDDQLVPLLRKSLKIVTVIAGAVFVLQNMNVDVGSLLAGLGLGGLAVALAAKDTLANLFGSVMIFVDRPFQIGDWVVVNGAEGIVEEVGFRTTRIRTFYNSLVILPNSVFTESKIDNYGARTYRRTYVTLNLTYDTSAEQMQAFVEGVRGIIEANPRTRKDYYEVHMSGFGAHSLDVMLYFFFKVPSWSDELRERHNVFLEVLRLAEKVGVRFAFPTQTLHVDSVAQPHPVAETADVPTTASLAEVVRSFGPGGLEARPAMPLLVPEARKGPQPS
jgi:MscS family membrane protein